MCPVPSGVPFPPSTASLPLTSIFTLLGIKAARVVVGLLLPSFPSVGLLIAWQKNPPDSAFCVVCWSWWGGFWGEPGQLPTCLGPRGAAPGVQGGQPALKPSPGWSAPCWQAGHRCTVPAWPCWMERPHTQRCLRHLGCCGGPRAGAPHTGGGRLSRGEPDGYEVVSVMLWPCLVQRGPEVPTRTDTKAAALRFFACQGVFGGKL